MTSLKPDRNITHLKATRSDHEGQGAERRMQSPPVPGPKVGCGKQLDDTTSEAQGLMHFRRAKDARHQQDSNLPGLLH